ncbi:MAG: bifunctional phosphopantothenoylcysteine decarboxylase/phosphopantothenate--cysteine ligase CoaBC, partial [Clostridiaceae bacterium]|nr:bifunctional phosphopantothenoylcysteine decarboxylase/phosphopantothenate--cysteine ligase CoaBC [Clostridiaceae bacterium]
VLFVPAMNHNMYDNPVVQANLSKLTGLGYLLMEPDSGIMACGTSGKGRLPDPSHIVDLIRDTLNEKRDMEGLKVLVTAGPTREAIDPVRYISNHSSGKMGYAIADAALKRGAKVLVISGPVNIVPHKDCQVVNVTSANEMYDEVMKAYQDFDILVMVAAVADYRCESIAESKIKKSEEKHTISLVKNPDIAKELGKVKGDRILIGFSAETDNLLENAKSKLIKKNMDMIVANDVTLEGAGFGTDTNIVNILKKDDMIQLPVMRKVEVAHRILDEALKLKAE